MNDKTPPANAMNELPLSTREFLARLTPEDIRTLEEGTKLITAAKRVGKFVSWLIVGLLGIWFGIVMLYESIVKMLGWMKG